MCCSAHLLVVVYCISEMNRGVSVKPSLVVDRGPRSLVLIVFFCGPCPIRYSVNVYCTDTFRLDRTPTAPEHQRTIMVRTWQGRTCCCCGCDCAGVVVGGVVVADSGCRALAAATVAVLLPCKVKSHSHVCMFVCVVCSGYRPRKLVASKASASAYGVGPPPASAAAQIDVAAPDRGYNVCGCAGLMHAYTAYSVWLLGRHARVCCVWYLARPGGPNDDNLHIAVFCDAQHTASHTPKTRARLVSDWAKTRRMVFA